MKVTISIGTDSVDIEIPDELLKDDVIWLMYLKPAIAVLVDNLE